MMKQVNIQFPLRMLGLILGLFLSVSAFAQIDVKGHVKDATGEPIIGATVRVDGTQTATITDFDGNFTLKANQGAGITISYVGYQDAKVKAAPNVVVTLQDDAQVLENVVVIGYGRARKSDLTGSVTAIKPDEKNHGLITNAQDMIQGKIAGVNVTTGGGIPGGGATIRIRGGSSLNASNDPLIVIDGLAMDNQGIKGAANPLTMVNPNDIESFTVLKDASATAIYGSRGSNGVIIITTKKGRGNMAPQVSYNGNVSYSVKKKTIDVLDGDAYRAFIKSYYGEDSEAASLLGTANTNWQDELFRGAISTDHNITVQGGFKNMPYRFSVGYTNQNGILKTSNFQRTTASLTLNPSFLQDHLKFNINGKFMYAHNRYANGDAIGDATRMDPTQPIYSSDEKYKNYGGYWQWLDSGASLIDDTYPTQWNSKSVANPLSRLYEKNDRANSYDYMGNVEVDYQVHGFEDLRLHANLSGDWANGKQKTDYEKWGPSNFYYGNSGYSYEKKYNLTLSAYAQYYKDFLKTQHFDVMVGYEWSHNKYWGDSYYAGLYPMTTGQTITNEDGSQVAAAGLPYNAKTSIWKSENYLVSFFGRANYIAWDRYMLTFTVRRDGSSRFKEHWATFPSVALGWKINEEAFLKNVKWMDELKLRLGWGKTGQQEGIGDYNYFATYNVNTTNKDGRYPIVGVNDEGLMYRPDAYNSDLKWETTTTSNIGLDFSLFNNRLSGSLDYYYRKTTDLINDAYVSAGSNFRNKVRSNIGSLENKGFEAAVTVRPIVSKDWQWEVTANFTYNKNQITELTGESSIVLTGHISAGTGNDCQAHSVGHPASSFYVYQQVYDANGIPLEGVYVDRNADGVINDSDRYFYKSPAAPYIAGLSSRVQYKQWDLGFGLRASFDNYVYWDKEAGYSNTAKRFDSSFGYLQNTIPGAIVRNWTTYDHALSDYFVHNASFLKCDNITLGYSFDKLFGIGGRVYASATNVFTITKYKGIDPEVSGGIDNNMYPRPLTFLVGLNLNF
ncbi:SusC/RagA family TonB-linked outer membrane protein [Xylanibacter ruminicola]|uniref:Iron complex outermembrane recepter protein n=1 Tax=Xylanibacter ruminicola TaxID=839 RepID=A0A1M6SV22_XYLRU|nr:TonB-dependent receptor [Xylanibacter ruminicola]SHK48497.1 iron complex outermembrane recepter protein [Xylanibacter ruminicola]